MPTLTCGGAAGSGSALPPMTPPTIPPGTPSSTPPGTPWSARASTAGADGAGISSVLISAGRSAGAVRLAVRGSAGVLRGARALAGRGGGGGGGGGGGSDGSTKIALVEATGDGRSSALSNGRTTRAAPTAACSTIATAQRQGGRCSPARAPLTTLASSCSSGSGAPSTLGRRGPAGGRGRRVGRGRSTAVPDAARRAPSSRIPWRRSANGEAV